MTIRDRHDRPGAHEMPVLSRNLNHSGRHANLVAVRPDGSGPRQLTFAIDGITATSGVLS